VTSDEWAGRRVLVTGAGGFIGANLARRLVDENADVHAMVRPQGDLSRLADVRTRLSLHSADMRDAPSVRVALRSAAPEFVFHVAAGGVLDRTADLDGLLATNAVGTAILLAAAEPLCVRRFVHVGGSSEYGPQPCPLRESDPLQPITPYGVSKAAATLAAQQAARARGFPVIVLRPFSVYGPWEAPSRLIPTAVAAALHGTELRLTLPGFRRDLVHVADVVDACLTAAGSSAPPGEVFNIGTGVQWANEEVVAMVAHACGRPVRTRVGAYQPHASDTACWVADTSKSQDELGWRARRTLEDGLAETVRWWSSRIGEAVPS
jgi:nucleoside-diphosphate-sugar epimerase